jgi:hypothetical protein
MSDLKIAVPGLDYYSEYSTSQFVIPAGAGATFVASNNIATITTNAAHGLTFSPSPGVLPNYFIQLGGSVSGTSGTGQLIGPVFRILSIPSTTTFTIYTTVTAATVTSTTFIPIFIPAFFTALISQGSPSPSLWYWNNATTAVLSQSYPQFGTVQVANLTLGANCVASYNPDNTNIVQDPSAGATIAVAPTMRTMLAASSSGQLRFGPQDYLAASGTTATSRISIVE